MTTWSIAAVLVVGALLAGWFAYVDGGGWPSLNNCVGMFMFAYGMCALLEAVAQEWGL